MDEIIKKVLIVEDDFYLNKLITEELNKKYLVKSATTVKEAIKYIQSDDIDFYILDINLPDGTGKQIVNEINQQNNYKPFMFLTVNDLEEDFVEGYQLGAIDYVTKPFSMKVLLTKIESLMNSFENLKKDSKNKLNIYKHRELIINFSDMSTTINRKTVWFSPTEYKILNYLIENKGILLSKNQILEKIWDSKGHFIEEHTLVTHMSKIRKKVEANDDVKIRTVYGMGYILIEL